MNIYRVLAVSRKETKQIIRDSRSLYLAIGIPIMLMILFGYALSLDVDNIPLAVWDQDRSPQSREFVDRLTSSGYFNLTLYTHSYDKIVESIDNNTVSVGITIPHDFAQNLKKGKQATIQAIVDGSDSTRAGIAMVYIETIVADYEADFQKEAMHSCLYS